MTHKRPENFANNKRDLIALCDELGFEYGFPDTYQMRIWGATHVIDIWPSRMTFHRVRGETIRAVEPYPRGELDFNFNREQVKKLLETGEV